MTRAVRTSACAFVIANVPFTFVYRVGAPRYAEAKRVLRAARAVHIWASPDEMVGPESELRIWQLRTMVEYSHALQDDVDVVAYDDTVSFYERAVRKITDR